MDPDQTAPKGAVCSGSTLFASILNLSEMLGNYLQQTISADDIFRCIFWLISIYRYFYSNFCWERIIWTQFRSGSISIFVLLRPDFLVDLRDFFSSDLGSEGREKKL